MKTPARFVELDALRGIAAMMVVLVHYTFFTAEGQKPHSLIMALMRPVTAGHEAVILFFLLSGFVLSLSTWKGSVLPYKDYIVRRIFRIYVPYLGALALAVLGCAVFYKQARSSIPWMNLLTTWSEPPTLKSVLEHIGFIGNYDIWRYNRPFWSLIIEMRISIIFPFVCLMLRNRKTWLALMVAVALSVFGTVMAVRYPAGMSWYSTAHYLAFFIVGALLARRLNRHPLPLIPARVRHAMVPASILLFAYAATLHRFLPSLTATGVEYILDWPTALGALGMIYLAATHLPVKRTLSHFIPRFLGRISYSLYLIHNLVLLALMTLLYRHVSIVVLFPIYLVLAIGISAAFHHAVERPAMEMGRRLTRPQQARQVHADAVGFS